MKGLASRRLWLIGSQADGDGARVFDFAIDAPMGCDLNAIPGQFFMLGIPGVGEAPFSYLDMPDGTGTFRALIRRRGKLTAALFAQPHGAALGYRGPCGVGWPLLLGRYRVLLITADHGLIALVSFVEEARRAHLRLDLNLLHFSGATRSRALDAAKERWKEYVNVLQPAGEETATLRRQGQPFLEVEQMLDGVQPEAVLCGAPETFMRAAASLCTARDIRPDNIWLHIERPMPWSSGLCGDCRSSAPCPCPDGPVHRYDRYRPPVDGEAQSPEARLIDAHAGQSGRMP